MMEEPDTANEETSEAEDLLLSDAEDTLPLDQEDITLRIDYNARIITKENKCENDGDDCNMHFVDKNSLLGRRVSEAGFHTSTEDLNVSEDEEKSCNVLTLKSVNLDGIASTSKNVAGSLSTLNYSHTVFKDECSANAGNISDDEISNMKESCIRKGKYKTLPPGLTVAGLSCAIKTASSIVFPTTQKALDIEHAFTNSLLLDENIHDAQDEQESPPMTCLEFLKSEFSDGNNTDAEDISVGSMDDIGMSRKDRNLLEKDRNALNIPMSQYALSSDNIVSSCDKNGYLGDSRRSSAAEFHTEDEIFSMENFPDRCQKRVKKRNFRIVDKSEVSADSGTDEEIL